MFSSFLYVQTSIELGMSSLKILTLRRITLEALTKTKLSTI